MKLGRVIVLHIALMFFVLLSACDDASQPKGNGIILVTNADPANGNGEYNVIDAWSVGSDEPSLIFAELTGPNNYEAELQLFYEAAHPENTQLFYNWGPEGCIEEQTCFFNGYTACTGMDCDVSINYETLSVTFDASQLGGSEDAATLLGSITFVRH